MNNSGYYDNNNLNTKLKIIFLVTVLSFGLITNIFHIGSSFSFSFGVLKAEGLESKEYVLESEKKKQTENNNYYKDSNFNYDNSRYLIPS